MKRSTPLKAGQKSRERGSTFKEPRSDLRRSTQLSGSKLGSKTGGASSLGPSRLKSGKGFAASPQQRAKVRDQACIVCAKVRHDATIDPAHVVSRGLGGCDHEDCVVALCRLCHHRFDREGLDLLPYLEPRYRPELQHAVSHLGLIGALERITHERWTPTPERKDSA